jgi:hypothetical protein
MQQAKSLHSIRIPLLVRLALTELAERKGVAEEELLETLIADAVRRELLESANKEEQPCARQ